MRCSNYQAELTPGAKFCIGCGAPVAVESGVPDAEVCGRCGESISHGKKFCSHCGAS